MQTEIIHRVINLLKRLPGIGPKMAERLTYQLLTNKSLLLELTTAFTDLNQKIVRCDLCNDFADMNPCSICSDKCRDKKFLCIVEHHQDMHAIESSKSYNGLYYILGSSIAPLEGKMPKDMDLTQLLERIKMNEIEEIIIATDIDTEGELTAEYIAEQVKLYSSKNLKLTRIARGLPSGSEIEYADSVTLSFALKNRVEIKK